jgi:hypothetical protein
MPHSMGNLQCLPSSAVKLPLRVAVNRGRRLLLHFTQQLLEIVARTQGL